MSREAEKAVRDAMLRAVRSSRKHPADERVWHVLGYLMGEAKLTNEETSDVMAVLHGLEEAS